ncbi:MAG: ATP-binding cassette domain-containing protein [Alphaproteobacteria bacterium]|nr:ATP-binding cassette domain-containing protein [Alphaproteobacteria bacterium]
MTMLLEVSGLEASYGAAKVLFGMEFSVPAGKVVTLMGRNGMGKTTTIRALLGMISADGRRIVFDGDDVTGRPSYRVAQAGLGLVPEGRQIFPTLSVEENLVATSANRHGATPGWSLERVYEFFRACASVGRTWATSCRAASSRCSPSAALMTNPKLLILDEATEGLAPLVRAEIWTCLERLKGEGQSILVVDKECRCAGKARRRPCRGGEGTGGLVGDIRGTDGRRHHS